MFSVIRTGYGYTSSEILDEVELYGISWIEEEYKLIIEHEASDRQFLLNIATVAHTPQTKEGARSVAKRYRSMMDAVQAMTPWIKDRRKSKNKSLIDKAKEIVHDLDIIDPATRK